MNLSLVRVGHKVYHYNRNYLNNWKTIFMNLKQTEKEALHLPESDRAKLAQHGWFILMAVTPNYFSKKLRAVRKLLTLVIQSLLLSLDSPPEDEVENHWLRETQTRAKELGEGIVQPISTEEVRRKAQALLR